MLTHHFCYANAPSAFDFDYPPAQINRLTVQNRSKAQTKHNQKVTAIVSLLISRVRLRSILYLSTKAIFAIHPNWSLKIVKIGEQRVPRNTFMGSRCLQFVD